MRHEAPCHIPDAVRRNLENNSWGLMAYLDLKGEGDNSMLGKQWPCPNAIYLSRIAN